ncbi:MAG: response regulator [Pseudomonadota bacterium]
MAATSDVLIVDDEVLVLEVVQAMLARLGHESKKVLSGESAVNALAKSKYDLVLLDLVLPKMDGLDVYRKIRKHSGLPVLFMTGYPEQADELELDADDKVEVLRKPYTLGELQSKLAALLPTEVPSALGEDSSLAF